MKKRVISILLALCLTVGLLPTVVLAEGEAASESPWKLITPRPTEVDQTPYYGSVAVSSFEELKTALETVPDDIQEDYEPTLTIMVKGWQGEFTWPEEGGELTIDFGGDQKANRTCVPQLVICGYDLDDDTALVTWEIPENVTITCYEKLWVDAPSSYSSRGGGGGYNPLRIVVNGTLNLYNEVTSGNEILVNGTLTCGQNSVLDEVGSITVNDGGRLNANQTTLARSVTVNDGASMDVGGWWVNVRDLTISSGAEVTHKDIASMSLYGTLTLGDGVELDVKSLKIATSGSYYTGDNTVAIVADGTAAVKNTISLDAAFGASVSLTLQGNLTVDAITVDTNRNETEESLWGDATMTIPAGSHVKIDYINSDIYGADSDLTINVAGTLEFEESGGSNDWRVGNLVLGETAEDGTITEGTVILRPSAKLFDDYEDTEAPVSGKISGNGTIKMYARVVPDYYEGWGWYPGLFGYNYSESEIAPLYEKGYIADTVTIWRNWNEADFSCEHEWDDGVTVMEPTETREGWILFTCAHCGTEKVEFIPATGSDEDNKPVDPVDPVPTITFTDIPEEAWFRDSVNTAVSLGLINGMGNNEFQPDVALTRGMLVVLLYRLAGEPAVNGKNTFTDVNAGAWYETAIIWAAETGITTGFPNGTFVPDDSVTREQAAVFFRRFAKQTGNDDGARAELSTFPDVSKVSEYAADSMAWAVKNGILSGNSINGTVCLDPRGSATRAQGAAIMVRFYNSFVK